MIPPDKNPLIDRIFYIFLLFMIRRRFHCIHIRGIEHLKKLEPQRPTIAFSNHTNWWDGLLVFLLTRFSSKNFYCVMNDKQLRLHSFFTRLGAFSIDTSNSVRSISSIRFAIKLLQDKNNLLWIFPQGAIRSRYEPIRVEGGTHFLSTKANHAQMLPAAFHYDFLKEEKPEAFVFIGEPFPASESSEERIERELSQLTSQLLEMSHAQYWPGFEPILKPSLSINKKWEWIQLAFRGRLREFHPKHN